MVRGSRHILSLLGEVKVNPVGQMQSAEEESHDAVRKLKPWRPVWDAERKKPAATCNKRCAEEFNSSMHEEPGGAKRATVKPHPRERQPEHADDTRDGKFVRRHPQSNNQTQDASRDQRRQKRLSDTAGGGRQKGFRVLERLTPHEEERASQRHYSHAHPITEKGARRLNLRQHADDGGDRPERAIEYHDRRKRAAVERGALHQSAD